MKDSSEYHAGTGEPGHLDENGLAWYADFLRGDAGPVPERMVEHVAACAYCRAELMAITDLLDQLPDLVEEPYEPLSAPGLKSQKTSRQQLAVWLRTVAALAAVGLLAWVVQRLLPDAPVKEPLVSIMAPDSTTVTPDQPDSLVVADHPPTGAGAEGSAVIVAPRDKRPTGPLPDTVLYAAAFIPNPAYENMIGAKYRAGTDPKVAGPDPGRIIAPGDTLIFSWNPDPDDAYLLLVVTNRDSTVCEINPGPNGKLAWKADLKPGLYYWKFLGQEDLWKVGRVKVVSRTP